MSIEVFKEKLKETPEIIVFSETIEVIETYYNFTPTAFTNGNVNNESGQNSGSCKLLAFAQKEGLTKAQTLTCFGQFFKDVQNAPQGTDHQNIRNFMKTGFDGLTFKGEALKKK